VVSLLKVWMYNLSGKDSGGLELELLLAMAGRIIFCKWSQAQVPRILQFTECLL